MNENKYNLTQLKIMYDTAHNETNRDHIYRLIQDKIEESQQKWYVARMPGKEERLFNRMMAEAEVIKNINNINEIEKPFDMTEDNYNYNQTNKKTLGKRKDII